VADYIDLIAAILACVGALIGFGSYLKFRTRRDRVSEIGESFVRITNGLGSDTPIERLSSAAMLPRFFSRFRTSEYAIKGLPYADDAIMVATAALKTEPTGIVQKALADGLAQAPSLRNLDFQRANLRNCYWGNGTGRCVDASGADFFHADLSAASMRGAKLVDAQFVGAQLVGTVLKEANLTGCNFQSANLRDAIFDGATLTKANFTHARNVPRSITELIDPTTGIFTGCIAPATTSTAQDGHITVFLSCPSCYSKDFQILITQISQSLAALGADLVTFPPHEYGAGAPLDEVKQRIAACDAVIILGIPQLVVIDGVWRSGTEVECAISKISLATPWNHIEAGIAAALDKPILIIRDKVIEGVFEIGDQPHAVTILDINAADPKTPLSAAVTEWAEGISDE
jgi:hypothetical protein